ncbi:Alpha/Beta hydrolase protein [Scenedesmus sp. NREL 46B-D3]|nr:Alpha/Beta hydrolase protein [Scenedesmus sp. NREL 46B-D3]
MATEKPAYEPTTEFGKRNPYLAAIVPDAIENAVDALLPDAFEAVLDRRCERVYYKYQRFRTDMLEGIGEVAGVLFRVAKHAYEKFHIHDLVFGVYHLALHHATVDAVDAVEGSPVHDQALIHYLIQATDAAAAAYCPTRQELCDAAGIDDHHLLLLEPVATTTRPAYALWVDAPNKRLVWGFRGTTDLNDMLTDACASCVPYDGGYAHWGMLQAAQWFAANELPRVKGFLDQHPGYDLLLVGHSLGAGTAAMLAHLIKSNAEARKALEGVKLQAVGVATPAVLTEALAAGCSDYITSVVLMHDVVPRFSIHNVFAMKEEMDATQWGDILADTLKDWAVPDVIEHSATYQRLTASSKHHACTMRGAAVQWWLGMSSWAVSMLHFYGILKPNPDAQQGAKGAAAGKQAAAATPEAARSALADAQAVAGAVAGVQDSLANVAQEDVHQVFAPGRLFFIKRLDKYKGRAKYGNNTHR